MNARVLARTVEIATKAGTFDPRKLPKNIRVAVDSAPLEDASRVEDKLNLLGHAARKVLCAPRRCGKPPSKQLQLSPGFRCC
jgi:hypothetical protein